VFLTEFSSLLEELISTPSELIITGDFNFHVDTPTLPPACSFPSLLDTFSLTQHVLSSTHTAGHTLDLLITRSSSTFLSSVDIKLPYLSDHHAICSSISVSHHSRPPSITKTIRSIKSINTANFSTDILSSDLFTTPAASLDSYLNTFTDTITTLLDKHAPLKTISISSNQRKPFITPLIRAEKSKRSRLETIYRRSRSSSDLLNFKTQARLLHKLIASSRRTYYRSLISLNSLQPRKLWSTLNSLLSRNIPPILPCSSSTSKNY
jgi:hypothetical protein